MLGHRRLLVVASGLLALSACCKSSHPITNVDFSCSDLDGDVCTLGPDGGGNGGCADHTYCLPVLKSDPDYSNPQAQEDNCHKCYFETRSCQTGADCCPGQICNTSLNLCFDCYNLDNTGACGQSDCTSDADCVTREGPGHICVTYNSPDGGAPQIPNEQTSNRCSYPTCTTDSDCSTGATCFPEGAKPYGYCVPQTPCSGSCAAGTACAITDDLCSTVPTGVAACQQSCAPGSMLVFVDESVPTGVYDACNRPAVTCTCAILPPIKSDDLGRYSSLAATGGEVWVSSYDGEYGDLVAYHFAADGGLIALESVDGVPAACTVVADPNGYRGGCATAGPNVGEWTSLVIGSDGQPRISYYDVDHGSLKYAQRSAAGTWTTQWVDGFDGSGTSDGSDLGLYTSIALNAAGNPVISYFQAGGPTATAPLQTALKIAVANGASPTGTSSWTTSVVDSANKPAPPCFPATCTSSQTCVGTAPKLDGGPFLLSDGGCEPSSPPDNGGSCLATASKCGGDAGCSSSEACVSTDAGAACMPTFAAAGFADLVQGVGLFSSLAFDKSGNAVIAYYDRLHGDLRLARGGGDGGAFTITTVDGTDPTTCDDTGNVGLFPSLKINGSTLAIAYQDQDSEQLLYWTGTAPGYIPPTARVVVDTGTIQAPAPNNAEDTPMFIGAGVSLAFGQSGTAYFAYQNQTQISLRLSSEPAGCGTATPSACGDAGATVINEWTAAPEGFYSQVAIDGTQGYVSSAQIKALATGVDDTLIMQAPQSLP